MFDVGLPEFFVLGLVALLVFGPERLPEVALQAARLIRRLKGMAESARTDLTADLEPHLRELKELRELDPRKMAKRYILDPVDEDGSLKELRGKNLLAPASGARKATKPKAAVAGSVPATATAAGEDVEDSPPLSPGSSGGISADGPAIPPAMAPAVTPPAERPPYDPDAT